MNVRNWTVGLCHQIELWGCATKLNCGAVPPNWTVGLCHQIKLWGCATKLNCGAVPLNWTVGLCHQIEPWGCATKSNIAIIQHYQSKLLRTMTDAPWYVSNHTLHTDLRIPYVRTMFQERTAKHRTVLTTNPNPTINLLLQQTYNRRLKRR